VGLYQIILYYFALFTKVAKKFYNFFIFSIFVMNKKGLFIAFSSIFVFALSLYFTTPVLIEANAATKDNDSFNALSKEVEKAQTYTKQYKDENGIVKSVSFDEGKAKRDGVSQDGTVLGKELTDFTNELIQLGSNMFSIDINKYPHVNTFFSEATNEAKRNKLSSLDFSFIAQAVAADARSTCGYYNNPKPNRAQTYRFWGPYSDPQAVARSWGYHAPPAGMGSLGWTRARTWNSSVCSTNSYRDEAVPQTNGELAEQNYAGWTPNGEPNPEIWSYGWPYSDWGAYVYWWHRTF
jgi:hypothetical protein